MTDAVEPTAPLSEIGKAEWKEGLWHGLNWKTALNGSYMATPKDFALAVLQRYRDSLAKQVAPIICYFEARLKKLQAQLDVDLSNNYQSSYETLNSEIMQIHRFLALLKSEDEDKARK